ncbi:hypothetical protein, partial [Rhizobium leguminosarum]|uniref:hypothetical protein n=1 Tax=Rhizobium leguminosarum TaxID=384 RepID=UPI0021BBF483
VSVPPIDTVQLAMILGSLALASWIAAGLIALIGPAEEIKHIDIGWTSRLLTAASLERALSSRSR